MRHHPRLLLGALVLGSFGATLSLAGGCGGGDSSAGSSAETTATSAGGAMSSGNSASGAGGNSAGAGGATGGGGTASSTAATMSATTGSGMMSISACQGHVYECGDLIDNDNDGLIDSEDPDCLGPCDNTEGGFYGGIPGQAGPACTVDCYFDQDSGSGNDDCHWNHKCDPHETAPGFYPESNEGAKCAYDAKANTSGTSATCAELYVTQSQACHDYCGPLTPNGCDCFGCCELPAGKGKYVWLGSEDANGNGSCSLADLNDPTKCQPCLPVQACLNTCDKCELCIGKTTLPPECGPGSGSSSAGSSGSSTGSGGGGTQCPDGIQPCGLPGQATCPNNSYCITGCCQQIPG